jgi:glycosyltransferase involved in cell wall biosynthesis
MTLKKIAILSPTLSTNAVGRAYLLAKLLQDNYSVNIIGPGNLEDIWPPIIDDQSIEFSSYDCNSINDLLSRSIYKIDGIKDCDLIYAVKPLLCSYGLGLLSKYKFKCPLLLDIDDWEIGFLSDHWRWELQIGLKSWLTSVSSPLYVRLLDRMTRFADGITVSNSFLQAKFGGYWIPHARDERLFQNKSDTEFDNELNVMFLGTPRAHKGLDVLLSAWRNVKCPNARLKIIGISEDSDIFRSLLSVADSRTILEGHVPISELPNILSKASIIVIPQLAERGAVGQLPAKLIDAMASGKPIISTSVGDIPNWLSNDSGIVVPPGNIDALTMAINDLLDNSNKRYLMGKRAKERFIKYGSYNVVRPRLVAYVESIISGNKFDIIPADSFAKSFTDDCTV